MSNGQKPVQGPGEACSACGATDRARMTDGRCFDVYACKRDRRPSDPLLDDDSEEHEGAMRCLEAAGLNEPEPQRANEARTPSGMGHAMRALLQAVANGTMPVQAAWISVMREIDPPAQRTEPPVPDPRFIVKMIRDRRDVVQAYLDRSSGLYSMGQRDALDEMADEVEAYLRTPPSSSDGEKP